MFKKTVIIGFLGVTGLVSHADIGLVGSACDAGWNCDLPEMFSDAGNGEWVWEGRVYGGEVLKFIDNVGSWNSWVAQYPDAMVRGNEVFNLNYFTPDNGVDDNKFRIKCDAYVRITVNTNERTAKFEFPYFYLCGNATCNGWDISKAQPIFGMEWTGMLFGSDTEVKDFKITQIYGEYMPCWNAASANEELTVGDHVIMYNDGDNGVVDNKFRVNRTGLYTLKISFSEQGDNLSVSRADEPDLRGAFRATPGMMMMAYDHNIGTASFAAVPNRIFIGDAELSAKDNGVFEGTVTLDRGSYVLKGDNGQSFSPLTNENLANCDTEAIVPWDNSNGKFKVTKKGIYHISANLAGATEWGGATYPTHANTSSYIVEYDAAETIDGDDNIIIGVNGRVITCSENAEVYNLSGIKVSKGKYIEVVPGVYFVKVGETVQKIMVK